ncbi:MULTISPECIES: I78 family peptidase inhibitor [Streptomyces]|uniref:Proteinase inhibitor I78 n=4 Tax=Streptomyces TaxID=1883 RepID=A0A8H9LQ95_9ACTN|nr:MULTISPECIES: I78 family peptidase inhibitor [Streptomyces]NEE40647.1 hypothetical protein [Streptomyces sp. SID7982]NEE56828.1 hypothetical protein [Streptomyces sp. SID8455]MBL3807467.1 hypothetical protein [Streptomyces sp. BRB081]MDQ0296579.1 hypothetical protein [Streptomyces sp. DSM 41037]NEC13358.1 hypothetical protein [Streptomyces sp. SID8014]
MASLPTPPPEPQDDPAAYVGLTAEEAERQAGERGWSTVRRLQPGAMITMEFLAGRINFEVADGRVTRGWKG